MCIWSVTYTGRPVTAKVYCTPVYLVIYVIDLNYFGTY